MTAAESEPAPPSGGPAWLTAGRILRGGGAVALVALLLATKWYGVDTHVGGDLGQGSAGAVSGWRLLTDVRWLVLLSAGLSLLSVLVPESVAPWLTVLAGALAALLTVVLFVRVLVVWPDSSAVVDIKPGAYLALVAAGACALGARRSELDSRIR